MDQKLLKCEEEVRNARNHPFTMVARPASSAKAILITDYGARKVRWQQLEMGEVLSVPN